MPESEIKPYDLMQDHSFTVRYCAWMIIIDIVPLRECGNDHAPFCFGSLTVCKLSKPDQFCIF